MSRALQRACCAAACLLLLVQVALAQKKVLVLTGDDSIEQTHSTFLGDLKDSGFSLDIKSHKDSDLKLRDYDHWLYDSLLLLAPKATSFGGKVSSKEILEFVDSGRNLLMVAEPGSGDAVRSLAAESGVDLDDKNTAVYDHFHYQAAGGASDHTLVTSTITGPSPIVLNKLPGPVLFKGIAHTVPFNSELVTVALSAEATAYSHDPKKSVAEPPTLPVGVAASLVSAVQARNNARILVAGSLALCSDELYTAAVRVAATDKEYPVSGNRAFCAAAARWALQDTGVLRVANVHQRIVGGEVDPPLYRVKDNVEWSMDITEVEGGKTGPYKADDVQLSFVMLDPYYRVPLQHDGKGHFSLKFQVPDVYGVFKYVIDYKRRGYSYIALQQVVPVRPFKHDEYERFLLAAYPYYAGAASTMAAFLLVGLAVLYTK